MELKFLASVFLVTVSYQSVNSYNILGIFPYNGKSHFIVFRTYLLELAKRGHNVTVISPFPEKNPPKNYKDIDLSESVDLFMEEINIEDTFTTTWNIAKTILTSGNKHCKALLENQEVQDLVKDKVKFDVVVFEQFNTDCALGIAYKLNAPTIALTSSELIPWYFENYGLTLYGPSIFPPNRRPGLIERVISVVGLKLVTYYYKYVMQREDQNIIAKHFNDVPPLEDLAKEIKFLLCYQNFVLTRPRILPTNVIEVGGFHVQDAKPLSGKLKKFIEESEHGVVYISFGSIVKSSSLPNDKRQAILDAMNEFPQRFVWKWEDDSLQVDKSKIYIDHWLPQNDILGHPKVLAFFTHSGLGSTMEATYHGVPMLAMPITAEQPLNAGFVESIGTGVQIQYVDLTKEKFVAQLKKVLELKFQQQAKEVSKAFRDRPQSALDTAIFWTEFAARYPNLSFRSDIADLPFYQYAFIDVIFVLLLIIVSPIALLIVCCRKNKKIKDSARTKSGIKNKSKKE